MTTQYRVRVRGHLDPTWTVWFDELTLTQTDDGTTELVGPLSDQSALYGLLARLRDLGATLLLVEQLARCATASFSPCQRGVDKGGCHAWS